MEEICEKENYREALRRVKANQGSPGVDAISVDELPGYLVQHWPAIRDQLLSGTYRPQTVRRVKIPKLDGGMRKLGGFWTLCSYPLREPDESRSQSEKYIIVLLGKTCR